MLPIRKNTEIPSAEYKECHDGVGTLLCKNLLVGCEAEKFMFMHCDDMKAGVSIGVHDHTRYEEVYYLVSGKGILTFDGVEYEMVPGDVSLCKIGHSHGFLATEDSVLIVVA